MFPPLFFLLTALLASSTAAKLPKKWKTCPRNDPNLNACLKKAITDTVLDDVMAGVPSLGILPMSPLHFVKLEMGQKESKSPVAINLIFKEIDIKGFERAVIDTVNFNWNKGRLQASFSIPSINLMGNYEIDGKILLLPIVGDGKCNFTINNVKADLTEEGSMVTKKGKQHFHVDKVIMKLKTNRVFMQLDNLFNGDKTLGDNMNNVLNENWEEVFSSFQDTLERAFGAAFLQISNTLFNKVPLDDIAPN